MLNVRIKGEQKRTLLSADPADDGGMTISPRWRLNTTWITLSFKEKRKTIAFVVSVAT